MSDAPEAALLLDSMANPHPRLWREAVEVYTHARTHHETCPRHVSHAAAYAEWFGFWHACLAATGYDPPVLWATFVDKLAAAGHKPDGSPLA